MSTWGAGAVLLVIILCAYLVMMIRYGSTAEWAVYLGGAVFSLVILVIVQRITDNDVYIILLLVFILWSFLTLIFVIANTTERTRQTFEAERAQDVITSGRE